MEQEIEIVGTITLSANAELSNDYLVRKYDGCAVHIHLPDGTVERSVIKIVNIREEAEIYGNH